VSNLSASHCYVGHKAKLNYDHGAPQNIHEFRSNLNRSFSSSPDYCRFLHGPAIWDRLHTLHPTPETESAFLKNYSPQRVIERFEYDQGSGNGHIIGGEPGRNFVTHKARIDWYFTIRSERWLSLMGALGDDVPMQLLGNGAQILSQNGNPRDGFRFEYKICKSVGTLAILPLAINSGVYRLSPLPKGLLDVTARIELMETWFPKTPGVITMGRQ